MYAINTSQLYCVYIFVLHSGARRPPGPFCPVFVKLAQVVMRVCMSVVCVCMCVCVCACVYLWVGICMYACVCESPGCRVLI